LKAAAIRGVWDNGTIRAPKAPDKRNVYLQKLLKMSGFEFGPVDGIIGRNTILAIRRFQSAAGLPVTGKFDKTTVASLRSMHEQMKKVA
jgi:peptidoglycan hydrolase-like protein with peptidoglycan-binding domain